MSKKMRSPMVTQTTQQTRVRICTGNDVFKLYPARASFFSLIVSIFYFVMTSTMGVQCVCFVVEVLLVFSGESPHEGEYPV